MMNEALDNYVNVEQLSKALCLSRSGIYQMCKAGVLPAGVRLGRNRRWRVADVKEWLHTQQKGVRA